MDSEIDDPVFELLFRLKQVDRRKLAAMPPGKAQEAVDALLQPTSWSVAYPDQLAWPGDLADDEED